MKAEALVHEQLAPPREQIKLVLAQIEGSAAFRSSRRHRMLLRHLIERTLAGELASLKETVLAVEVFERDASRFDPRTDTIVRVETRRLRQRLAQYFDGEGRDAPLRIELPVGSYVPLIAQRRSASHAPEATRRARDLAERGEHFLRQPLGAQPLEQALERFDAALRESPGYVPALIGAGRAWFNLGMGWYREPRVAAAHAAEALRAALEIEPQNGVALALMGAIEHSFGHNWPAAQRHFRRAAEVAPELAFVHSAWGAHLMYRGELAAAEHEVGLARRLDPQYFNARMHMVNVRLGQGRLDDAWAELEAILDIAPDSMPALGLAAVIAIERGQPEDAVRWARRARDQAPSHGNVNGTLAAALGFAGRVAEADALLQALPKDHAEGLSPYVKAVVAARCARPTLAMDLLETAIDAHDPSGVILQSDPSFRSLHGQPRWPALLAAVRTPRPLQ